MLCLVRTVLSCAPSVFSITLLLDRVGSGSLESTIGCDRLGSEFALLQFRDCEALHVENNFFQSGLVNLALVVRGL